MTAAQLRSLVRESVAPIRGRLYRVVESQEQVATTSLVDSLEEQALLEELIEHSKPPKVSGTEKLHYLLATPFRYPPLPWGSRFGGQFEPGIFYGSLSVDTVLAETAYYRSLFFRGMKTAPGNPLSTQHDLFAARYTTDHGVQLQHSRWQAHRETLTHPEDYGFCQHLGSVMREDGIEAFEFISARAVQVGLVSLQDTAPKKQGLNIGLYTPAALNSRKPDWRQKLLATVSAEQVTLSLEQEVGGRSVHRFEAGDFYATA